MHNVSIQTPELSSLQTLLFFLFILCLFIFNFFFLEYPKATYPEFVTYVQQFLDNLNRENRETGGVVCTDKGVSNVYVLKGGHLFDRLVSFHILSGDMNESIDNSNVQTNNSSSNSSSSSSSSSNGGDVMNMVEVENEVESEGGKRSLANTKISVTYMLVALNMAVRTAAEERVDALFHTAQLLSRIDPTNPVDAFGVNRELSVLESAESSIDRVTTATSTGIESVVTEIKVKGEVGGEG